MNVLLVTSAKNLAEKFAALNPELEYAAIVVDDVETAKKTLAQIGLSKFFVCPMTELIKCVEYLWYDYILCVQDHFYDSQINKLNGLPKEKIIAFATLPNEGNWETERHLRYYREHVQDFEMFATGTSPTEAGIDVKCFKYKAFNFATSSQDLYYNFQIAKHVILYGGGIERFAMLLSDSYLISSIMTFLRYSFFNLAYCLMSLLLMIYITFMPLLRFTKNFSAKNG